MRRKKRETDTKMVLMAKNMLATGFCISTAVVVFNPLDCLRIRWQVDRNTSTMTRFAKDIMKRQGLIRGLWAPGLGSNAVGAAMARGYVVGLLSAHVQHNTHTPPERHTALVWDAIRPFESSWWESKGRIMRQQCLLRE